MTLKILICKKLKSLQDRAWTINQNCCGKSREYYLALELHLILTISCKGISKMLVYNMYELVHPTHVFHVI